jgi:Tfp pilus assembly protein PilV
MKFRPGPAAGQSGFSILEVTMAILLLAISFVGLSAYSGTQRKALSKSGDLTEASTVAVTILEKTKIPLSDSAAFVAKYAQLIYPKTTTSSYTGKKTTFNVATTLSRVPGSDKLIRAKVKLTWPNHAYNTGIVLVEP